MQNGQSVEDTAGVSEINLKLVALGIYLSNTIPYLQCTYFSITIYRLNYGKLSWYNFL